ncbi:MAG TPA: cyclase family protein [Ilumatobacteraceae bacterium]
MATVIDLSHTIEHDMITYPGLPGPAISDHLSREASRSFYAPGTEFQIGRIEMVSNTGTYLDTPSHRYPAGHDLAGLPLDHVADVPGICVQVPMETTAAGPELLAGLDLRGHAVLFATGWDRHWRTDRYGDVAHPFLHADTAQALIDGGAVLAGIDSVNIDDTSGNARPIHSALLAAGVLIVEHMTGLDQLVGRSFRFFAVPPKVRGMGTFPVRALAIVA